MIIARRRASFPYLEIISSGSIAFSPRDFVIFLPSAVRIIPCKYTFLKGISPNKYCDIRIIRAIQKKSISCPVSSIVVG